MSSHSEWSDDDALVPVHTRITNPLFTDGWKEYVDNASSHMSRRSDPPKQLLEYRKPFNNPNSPSKVDFSSDRGASRYSFASDQSNDVTQATVCLDQMSIDHGSAPNANPNRRYRSRGGQRKKNRNRIECATSPRFCPLCYSRQLDLCNQTGRIVPQPADEGPWNSHSMYNGGHVTCPLLYYSICKCGAYGAAAHLPQMCPLVVNRHSSFAHVNQRCGGRNIPIWNSGH